MTYYQGMSLSNEMKMMAFKGFGVLRNCIFLAWHGSFFDLLLMPLPQMACWAFYYLLLRALLAADMAIATQTRIGLCCPCLGAWNLAVVPCSGLLYSSCLALRMQALKMTLFVQYAR